MQLRAAGVWDAVTRVDPFAGIVLLPIFVALLVPAVGMLAWLAFLQPSSGAARWFVGQDLVGDAALTATALRGKGPQPSGEW